MDARICRDRRGERGLCRVCDLAGFMLLATMKQLIGAFTVVGPDEPLTFASTLEACGEATGGHAARDTLAWADAH